MDDIRNKAAAEERSDNRKIISTVLCSLLLHILVAGLVVVNGQTQNAVKTSSTVVESYLIVKKAPVEKLSIDMTEVIQAQYIAPIDEVSKDMKQTLGLAEGQISSKKTLVYTALDIVLQNNQGLPDIEPIIKFKPIVDNDSTDQIKSTNSLIEIRKDIPSMLNQKLISATGLSNTTVKSVNQYAYKSMLQEETDTFNKLKNSPIIDTMVVLDTTVLLKELSPTVVNCAAGVSKTLAVMSQFTGGNMQCKQYEIQFFINKRLDKKPKQR